MKKILVPVDFSKQAEFALKLALQLAKRHNYKITAMYVIELPMTSLIDTTGFGAPPAFQVDYIDELRSIQKDRMEEFLAELSASDEYVETAIEVGNPYANIVDALNTQQFEMVIMGTSGATGMQEFFIGSNTEKIVRTANCPVIAVHEAVEMNKIKNIVFATGGKEVSEDLMQHIKQLQTMFEAKLHIVRINTPNNFERDIVMKPLLEKLAERYMLKNYQIHLFNDYYEDQGIIDFSMAIDADMIAMGTHGRKGLNHLMIGSMAEDVVNHSHKMIWTYKIKKD